MFNEKREETMKKFYSFLFAAAALVGFAACSTDEGIENVAPEQEGVMEFVASFGETRTTLDGMDVKWCAEDQIDINGEVFAIKNAAEYEATTTATFVGNKVDRPYFAVYPASAANFRYTVGAGAINHVSLILNANVAAGTFADGANIALAYNAENTTLAFENMLAVLKFQVTAACEEVTIRSNGFLTGEFNVDQDLAFAGFNTGETEMTLTIDGGFKPGVDYYTTVIPNQVHALTIEIDGVVVAEKESKTLVKNKIYNLGVLPEPLGEAHETFGIVGAHQGWDTANKDALYQIPNTNTYVRRNVTLADGFKFYGETSETVIVEHPAVTTGEEGDLYLVPNSNWKQSDARFAAYFFGTSGTTWASMKDDNEDGIYVVNKPTTGTYENVIFCRMNPANATNDWSYKWNQTGDLVIPTNGNNCFTVPSGSWDGATSSWSVHVPEVRDAWTEEVEEVTTYWFGMNESDDISDWVTGYSNNAGPLNITVADTSKKYDIYFSREADQDWGFVYYFAVREAGSAAPELK